jgi:hypothetical protein
MTSTIRNAAHATNKILSEVRVAEAFLVGDRSRINALGVLNDPNGYSAALREARAAIDRAIEVHADTNWPTEQDYHAI